VVDPDVEIESDVDVEVDVEAGPPRHFLAAAAPGELRTIPLLERRALRRCALQRSLSRTTIVHFSPLSPWGEHASDASGEGSGAKRCHRKPPHPPAFAHRAMAGTLSHEGRGTPDASCHPSRLAPLAPQDDD
jgi:hypothetical protein